MTNTTLNLGSEYVTFNYAAGKDWIQLQSNSGRDFKPIYIEELETMIQWFEAAHQNILKARREAMK